MLRTPNWFFCVKNVFAQTLHKFIETPRNAIFMILKYIGNLFPCIYIASSEKWCKTLISQTIDLRCKWDSATKTHITTTTKTLKRKTIEMQMQLNNWNHSRMHLKVRFPALEVWVPESLCATTQSNRQIRKFVQIYTYVCMHVCMYKCTLHYVCM